MQRHIDPSAVATAGTRAGSPVIEAYQEHFTNPAGSPPLCQSDDPLAAASSSGRGRSRKGPNLTLVPVNSVKVYVISIQGASRLVRFFLILLVQ